MPILTPTPEWLQEDAETQAEDLLRRLGFSGKLRGFRYLAMAISQTTLDPSRIYLITKALYPDIAKRRGSTTARVERAMRHSIHRFWECGGCEALDQVTHIHLTQRPTNSELIDLLASYIRRSH